MATSGSKISNRIGEYAKIDITLYWNRTSYSIANNTSTLSWTLRADNNSLLGSPWGDAIFTDNQPYEVQFNGKVFNGSYNFGYFSALESHTIATGTVTLPHNSDGTLSFTFTASQAFATIGTCVVSGIDTLDALPRPARILTAPNFNDEENPTITYHSPAGAISGKLEACISFTGAKDDVAYRVIDGSGSYTFNLTDAERKVLRQAITSGITTSVRFYLRNTIDATPYWDYTPKTLTLVNYAPTLSPTVVDTNSRTTALTGNSNKLIKYYSNARVTFGAAARKEATIISRQVVNGGRTIDIEDRAQDVVTVNGITSNTFYLTTTDSRHNITKDAVVFSEDNGNFIPYVKLTNSLKTGLLTGSGSLTFTISGNYFNGSFGAKNNSLEVEYRVEDENGNPVFNTSGSGWVILGTVSPTTDGNTYSYSYTITGLDYKKTYTLTVNAIDELTPVQTATKVIAAVPVFDWSKNDFRHHTNVYLDNNTTLRSYQADGTDVQILGINTNNNLTIGWGGYENENGNTGIYGNKVNLFANDGISINGTNLIGFVVSEGTSGNWFYRKWNNGRIELYGYQTVSDLACTTAMGGMYRTAVVTGPSFPFTVNSPKVVASYESEGYGAFFWATTLSTTAKASNYYLVRPTSSTGITGKVHFYVQGSWK